jgi:hypothetical protein
MSVGPNAGRFNRTGRRSWWYRRDVEGTLAAYGYRPRIHGVDPPCWQLFFPQAREPTRAASDASRSDSYGSSGRQRFVPYARPSGGVVICDGPRGSSSAPTRRTSPVKKEAPGSLPHGRLDLRRPKEEAVHPPPPPPPAKKWWEMELEAQAAYRGPNNPEDAPG